MRRHSVLLALLPPACSSGSPKPKPTPTLTPSIPDVKVFLGLSHDHMKQGDEVPTYPQSPPVGGKHSPAWLKCQVYTSDLPKQNAVHSMEHGGVWITYRTDLAAADIATLEQKQNLNKEFVLISPYVGQTAPVMVSTWGLQLTATGASDPRIDEFVRTDAGVEQGRGENGGGAPAGVSLARGGLGPGGAPWRRRRRPGSGPACC